MTSSITVSCLSGNLLTVKGNAYLGRSGAGLFLNSGTIMNCYEVYTTTTMNWRYTNTSGGSTYSSTGGTTPLMFVKIGRVVTVLQLPVSPYYSWNLNLMNNNNVSESDAIPPRFKPQINQYIPVTIYENAIYQGKITIDATGGKFYGPFTINGSIIYGGSGTSYSISFGGFSYTTS